MLNQPTPEAINRAQFLRSLGLSTAALSALYFTSCSKAADATVTPDPTDSKESLAVLTGNANPDTGKIDFTLDLTKSENAKLKTVGQFVWAGSVLVAYAKGKKYVAILNICTHDDGPLQYRVSQDNFLCKFHGAVFATDGRVLQSPAPRPLPVYRVTASADGNSLRVTE